MKRKLKTSQKDVKSSSIFIKKESIFLTEITHPNIKDYL